MKHFLTSIFNETRYYRLEIVMRKLSHTFLNVALYLPLHPHSLLVDNIIDNKWKENEKEEDIYI